MNQVPGEYRVVYGRMVLLGYRYRVCFFRHDWPEKPLPVSPSGETIEECQADFEAMREAFTKPVLNMDF